MVERRTTLDSTYSALAHPTRRALLAFLRSGGTRVTDLAGHFDVSLAAASKHIRVLESAGLVDRSVSGRDHLISMVPEPLAEARAWIDGYREFWEMRMDALDAQLRAVVRA